jgi:hypothetical protein
MKKKRKHIFIPNQKRQVGWFESGDVFDFKGFRKLQKEQDKLRSK